MLQVFIIGVQKREDCDGKVKNELPPSEHVKLRVFMQTSQVPAMDLFR
jgi:hypothetical protein